MKTRAIGPTLLAPMLIALLASGCDDSTGPKAPTGAITVSTITSGSSLDADGYVVTVDGERQRSLGINSTVSLGHALEPGQYAVELTDLASNCTVTGANPQTVTVVARATARPSFAVDCAFVPRDLAFTTDRDGNQEIYAMDADGSGTVRLTENLENDYDSASSPDGAKIAFARDYFWSGESELYVMDGGGSNPVALAGIGGSSGGGGSAATWSPDGAKIAFARATDFESDTEIHVMDADGSNVVLIGEGGTGASFDPAWSPDGTRIAFASDGDGNSEIYVMDADGSNRVRITEDPGSDYAPAWSPDGTKIAFARNAFIGGSELFVMDADGSNLVRLGSGWDPAWSPDGTKIAFTTDRDGNSEIYAMNADGSNPVNLTNHPADDGDPAWLH